MLLLRRNLICILGRSNVKFDVSPRKIPWIHDLWFFSCSNLCSCSYSDFLRCEWWPELRPVGGHMSGLCGSVSVAVAAAISMGEWIRIRRGMVCWCNCDRWQDVTTIHQFWWWCVLCLFLLYIPKKLSHQR
jgi:hypothetical protein